MGESSRLFHFLWKNQFFLPKFLFFSINSLFFLTMLWYNKPITIFRRLFKLKISIVTAYPTQGAGWGTPITAQAKTYVEMGHEVHIVTATNNTSFNKLDGVTYHLVSMGTVLFDNYLIFLSKKLQVVVKRNRPHWQPIGTHFKDHPSFYTIYFISLLGKYFFNFSLKNCSPSFLYSGLYVYFPIPRPVIFSLSYKSCIVGKASVLMALWTKL